MGSLSLRASNWRVVGKTTENAANKSRLAGRNVGNTTRTSVRAACQPQPSFLFLGGILAGVLSALRRYRSSHINMTATVVMLAKQTSIILAIIDSLPDICTHQRTSPPIAIANQRYGADFWGSIVQKDTILIICHCLVCLAALHNR